MDQSKNNFPDKVWNACGYVRLSHEDSAIGNGTDQEESNSVTGQKDLAGREDPRSAFRFFVSDASESFGVRRSY